MHQDDLAAYRLTPKAAIDLEDIRLHTAETWSPAQADRYIQALVAMSTMAHEQPEFCANCAHSPVGRTSDCLSHRGRLAQDHPGARQRDPQRISPEFFRPFRSHSQSPLLQ